MANTTFRGPIRQGFETGVTATRVIGHDLVSQVATVRGDSSGASNVVLPEGADLVGIRMIPVCAASAATSIAGQGINFRIGRSAGNDAFFGTVKVSGVTNIQDVGVDALNRTNASAASWLSIQSATQVFIDATAVTSASAVSEFGGRIIFTYFPR